MPDDDQSAVRHELGCELAARTPSEANAGAAKHKATKSTVFFRLGMVHPDSFNWLTGSLSYDEIRARAAFSRDFTSGGVAPMLAQLAGVLTIATRNGPPAP